MTRRSLLHIFAPIRFVLVGAAAFACLLATATPSAAVSPRNVLTIEGDVFDHLGDPVKGVSVVCSGTIRASTLSDSTGRYHLEVPGATLEELERTPLLIRIQARRKGWRFALAGGAPELGLEMKVTKLESRMARLRVRSNDSSAVEAVASSAVLDANPRALIEATFVGSRGTQTEGPPDNLTVSDEVMLAGDMPSIPELATRPPTTAAATGAMAYSPVSPSGGPLGPAPQSTTRVDTPGAPAVSPQLQPGPPQSTSSAAPTKPTKWSNKKKKEPDPKSATPVTATATPSTPPASPTTIQRKVTILEPGPAPTTVTPPATQAPAPQAAAPQAPAPQNAAPQAAAPPPAAKSSKSKKWHAAGDPGSGSGAKTVRPAEIPPPEVTSSDGSGGFTIGDGYKLVIPKEAPAYGTSKPTTPPGTTGTCDCTIRGTVEVRSDQALPGRTEVVIGIENAAGSATSIELFMGSPRDFEIRPAPCGVHKLLLWTRSRQRFVLASSEPRVVCTQGGTQQMRLVLEPVARWGASR